MIDAEHTLVVGATGGGKSTLTMAMLAKATSTIAMTTKLHDYDAKDGWIQVKSVNGLMACLAAKFKAKEHFKVCYRVPVGPDEMELPIKALDAVSRRLYTFMTPYAAKRHRRQIGLVVDEAHRFFPHNRPKGLNGFVWAISEGRAWGINILFATQRPTNIPPDFRDNVTNYYVLMLGGDRAKEVVRAFVGSELVLPEKYQYCLYRSGKFVIKGDTRTPKIMKQLP